MPAYNSHNLSLYCDNGSAPWVPYHPEGAAKPGEHRYGEFPWEFINPRMKECYKLARAAGWKFSKSGRMICPRCVQAGIK
jgi:hypothetical protein